jgi:hypothetical protein
MQRSRLFTALAMIALFAPCLWSQEAAPLFPLSEVRAGLRGVGRTVFEGDKVEDFQVEILGVLKNAVEPKSSIILARLSGGPLEKTGVIAGMSGSPVYVDGKLVGAVTMSFPFAKEPLAGITPIEEILQVVPEGTSPPASLAATNLEVRIARAATDFPDSGRLIPDDAASPANLSKLLPSAAGTDSFADLRLPLRLGGFSKQAIDLSGPLFRQMGFEPMQGGALSGGEATTPIKTDLEPGSMVSLLLVRGDLDANVDCTVTYRQGDNLYACGHPILSTGPVQFPFAPSRVLVTVPNLASSFKLDAPGPVVGTIRQDRFSAIYGKVGDTDAQTIPVHVHVNSTLNKKVDYNFEIVQEAILSPFLLNLTLLSTLTATEPLIGPSTLELTGKIRLAGEESIDLEDMVSGDIGTPNLAASAVATPLTYLLVSHFPDMRIEGIDLSVVARNEKRVATLEEVWGSKSEVRPGDHIEVTALLRLPTGEAITQRIPVAIPESVSDKMLTLVVGSGANLNALQLHLMPLGSPPRDLHQLVRALNRMRRNNRVYALLMAPERSFTLQGEEYPSPPPSLVQTFLSDPAVASSLVVSGTSVVGDSETKPASYTIRGQKTLMLKVVGPG